LVFADVVAGQHYDNTLVTVELQMQSEVQSHESAESSSLCLGSVVVSKDTQWMELEEKIAVIFLNHISEVSLGLQTKKTRRSDQDSSDAANPLTLGISLGSIKYYSIGDGPVFLTILHCVPQKKEATKLWAVTLSYLNQF